MSTVKVIKDGPQFERELREWLLAVKPANRNQKGAFFVAQLNHLIAGNKSGDRINFNSFQNAEFMRGIYDVFREALKHPNNARLDWGEIESFIDSVGALKRRKVQEEEDISDEDAGRPKKRMSVRKEAGAKSTKATRGGGATLSRKYEPLSPRHTKKPSSGRGHADATDEENNGAELEVAATQLMCYDPPCTACAGHGLPCIAPVDPNCLACKLCRARRAKCSKLEEIRSKAPTSKENGAEMDHDPNEFADEATSSRPQASLSRKEFDTHTKQEAEQISKLRRQVEGLERDNKNLADCVESLAETILQFLSEQKEDIHGAMDSVKSLKSKLRRGGH
ncbi:hypothetical protein BDN72DRAFT_854139 [Pluteus cervinus]|uniref:Uncharacterized protein n=1 Tax=Pluteus cervinus TaxID=181527 RepID=A0ACD3B9A6_9AGAR|nr:hypothetical protein BDN72DRAFT_854139 [Pluteus cervinus]